MSICITKGMRDLATAMIAAWYDGGAVAKHAVSFCSISMTAFEFSHVCVSGVIDSSDLPEDVLVETDPTD